MKLFLINTGLHDYDEYDALVVVAKDSDDARRWYVEEFLKELERLQSHVTGNYLENFTIQEIDPNAYTKAELILSSFRAS